MRNDRLWILTEEYPSPRALQHLIHLASKENEQIKVVSDEDTDWHLVPVVKDGKFLSEYTVRGVNVNNYPVSVRIVSGYSSFVDFLIFWGQNEPDPKKDYPVLMAEVTKTDDKESRNTGIYQRGTKFVLAHERFPEAKLVMHFDITVKQSTRKSPSHQFGRRLFETLNIEVTGVDGESYEPFSSIDEMIAERAKITLPADKGKPNRLFWKDKTKTELIVTSRLEKNNRAGHDPNIGYVSLVTSAVRRLGFAGKVTLTNHLLPDNYKLRPNKLNHMLTANNISIPGVEVEVARSQNPYWVSKPTQEKHASMILQAIATLAGMDTIYTNHGGCERSYYVPHADSYPTTIPKKKNGVNIAIPDIVLVSRSEKTVFVVEGKKYSTRTKGVQELNSFDLFEEYVRDDFPDYEIKRCLTLTGSGALSKEEEDLLFLQLNDDGSLVFGGQANEGYLNETLIDLGLK